MLDKVAKALGRDTVEEMDAMEEQELKKVIVDASGAMKTAKEELDANRDYQAAKADVSLLSTGKREVDKRQKAKIQYALDRIDSLGKLDPHGLEAFYKQREAYSIKLAKRLADKAEEERLAALGVLDTIEDANA